MTRRAPCRAPSAMSPTGVMLHCDRERGHRGRHAVTLREDDGRDHTYQWGPLRRRTQQQYTLSPEVVAIVDRLARVGGISRSAVIELAITTYDDETETP